MVKIFQRGQEVCQALQQVQEVYQAAQQDQEVCDPIREGCALLLLLHLLLLLQWWQVAFSELYGYNQENISNMWKVDVIVCEAGTALPLTRSQQYLRWPALQLHQGYLRLTEIVVYEGFSTGFELILGVPSEDSPPLLLQSCRFQF